MSAILLPNAKQGYITGTGQPLVGGKLFTYAAGTNTPAITWSDQAQTAPNTNPVVLDARGEATIYWLGNYKVILTNAFVTDPLNPAQAGGIIWTRDNVEAKDLDTILTAFARVADLASTANGKGAGLIGYLYGSTAPANTVAAKLHEWLSVKDFGAKGDGTTDDSAAIQLADNAATAANVAVWFPPGQYVCAPNGIFRGGASWYGAGRFVSVLVAKPVAFTNLSGLVSCQSHDEHTTEGLGFDLRPGVFPSGIGNPGNIYWGLAIQSCKKWAVRDCAFWIKSQCQGIAGDAGEYIEVTDNYFEIDIPSAAYSQACNLSFASGVPTKYIFARNVLNGCSLFSNGSNGLIALNKVYNWGFGGGLTVGPNVGCERHTFIGNECIGGSGRDINNVYPSGIESWSQFDIFIGNFCENNAGDGIGMGGFAPRATGNTCINNGMGFSGVTGTGSGISSNSISISGVNYYASEAYIDGNILADTQATATQKYGYAEYVVSGPALYNMHIGLNKVTGYMTAPYLFTSGLRAFVGPKLHGSATMTPGSIGSGAQVTVTISLPGARLGDLCTAAYTGDAQGCIVSGHIDANDSMVVRFANLTGSSKTLASAVINGAVDKPPSYTKYW